MSEEYIPDSLLQSSEKMRIGILTSGGDSPGMNAAVRAVVRSAITKNCQVYVIREGWYGLVRGNDPDKQAHLDKVLAEDTEKTKKTFREHPPHKAFGHDVVHDEYSRNFFLNRKAFVPLYGDGTYLREETVETSLKGIYIFRVGWDDVRGFLDQGGTFIGTARCVEFREREGRKQAALNLVRHNIQGLVVCGGDGSLTGADILRKEWPGLLDDLYKEGKITLEAKNKLPFLNIAGIVGSIDNDLALTDVTIGCETGLARICESVDNISSTASSHARAFVVEVMGRHCGWLALMAALSTGADFLFIPERPPSDEDWTNEMCRVLNRHREMGKRKSIVIVAEGATDCKNRKITATAILDVLKNRLKLDARITTLGHTQRGGSPNALDRVLATVQSNDAVDAIISAKPDTPSYIIGSQENRIKRVPLMEAVEQTQRVAELKEQGKYEAAMALRGPEFVECLHYFKAMTRLNDFLVLPEDERLKFGIMHMGAPAGGMNAASAAAARYAMSRGHQVVGIYNSWTGLVKDSLRELSWISVDQWTTKGGSELGTNRTMPKDPELVAAKLREHGIQGLIVIGGFETLGALKILQDALENDPKCHQGLDIPIVALPATISNNIPLTEWSLGSDTSVDVLMTACDMIKQSASASRNRVFVLETQGGECGYIPMFGSIASGASVCLRPETGVTIDSLRDDIEFLRALYRNDPPGFSQGRLVIQGERASKTYTTEVLKNILGEEGRPYFDSRSAQMGHTLQGGIPTPKDRLRGIRYAIRCIQFLEKNSRGSISDKNLVRLTDTNKLVLHPDQYNVHNQHHYQVLVVNEGHVGIRSIDECLEAANTERRTALHPWWEVYDDVLHIMNGRRLCQRIYASTPTRKLSNVGSVSSSGSQAAVSDKTY